MKKVFKEIGEVLGTFAIALICAFILMRFVFYPSVIDGKSMEPNYHANDFGLGMIISKNFGVNRFDTVIIEINKDKCIIKRVIGLPNEVIEYKDNCLYINGEYIEEDFLGDVHTDDFIYELKDNEYYCLGDNRDISADSRYYGPFNYEDFIATHYFKFYPLSEFGYHQ